jgi:hypothetical protein
MKFIIGKRGSAHVGVVIGRVGMGKLTDNKGHHIVGNWFIG